MKFSASVPLLKERGVSEDRQLHAACNENLPGRWHYHIRLSLTTIEHSPFIVRHIHKTKPGCSIVAFAIELIHHSWDTIPVESFKYSSSSLATDNLVRYGVQPRVLEVYTDRASIYMNKVLMVWHGSSSYVWTVVTLVITLIQYMYVINKNLRK
ncbi:hypothetical protein LOTGIDRAFT_237214 [Lottia gigantea]|uniref:Uncharacterized protein n=1 Tax=Lottia gigantea TaxID=225164 RepID=V3ZI94_LOTGI|nr:hypothetical protein LOTGIDRAFT_237214 [Lottia gigantea]ESO82035.1 hypothetical protein LOTGIDRAFT_237214 [Lottia gigantea]